MNLSDSPTCKSAPSAHGPYLNTPEAAEYLRVSKRWLEKLRCIGGGPVYSQPGDRVIYRQCDLDNWIAQHLRKNTSDNGEVR